LAPSPWKWTDSVLRSRSVTSRFPTSERRTGVAVEPNQRLVAQAGEAFALARLEQLAGVLSQLNSDSDAMLPA